MLESSVSMLFDEFKGDVKSNENDLESDEITIQQLRMRVFLGKCPIKMDYNFNLDPRDEAKVILAREEWGLARQYVEMYKNDVPGILEDVSTKAIDTHIVNIDKAISRYISMREV